MKKVLALFILLSICLLNSCSNKTTYNSKYTDKNLKSEREIIIPAKEVKKLIENESVLIAEVSWGDEKDSKEYLKNHIKNAIHINTDMIEEGPVWNLIEDKKLIENVKNLGIDIDTKVILYGEDPEPPARVCWALKYLGVKNVKILDGGLQAWKKENFPLEKGSVKVKPISVFKAHKPLNPQFNMSIDQVVQKLENDKDFKLVSVRSKQEWLGKESGYTYIPKAGEVKGAIWGKGGSDAYTSEDYLNEDGTYKSWQDIQKMYEKLGFKADNNTAYYCGTGWRAAIPWIRAYENGIDSMVFDGGWNEWQMHDELFAQVGDPKSDDFKIIKVKDLPKNKASK
ncbi:MAG: rhodanese-like domain-containing protein [Tissierellia bacterium]|nr:rhodanese-like domain-containing protein [Tissierellia bacterium]